jgi:hypothetical protein
MRQRTTLKLLGGVIAGLWLLGGGLPPQQAHSLEATSQHIVPIPIEETQEKVAWQFFLQNGSTPTDVCDALAEARRQQVMVLFAYQNTEVLKAAEDSGMSWREYSGAVENLVRRVYAIGAIEDFDFARDVGLVQVLFEPAPNNFDPGEAQVMAVLETHSNGTVWGFDEKANRVLLVNRGGMIIESSQEVVIQAHKQLFGEAAGEWLYFAHLKHELKHRQQLLGYGEGHLPSLGEYRQNELEAYQASIQFKEQALETNGCF